MKPTFLKREFVSSLRRPATIERLLPAIAKVKGGSLGAIEITKCSGPHTCLIQVKLHTFQDLIVWLQRAYGYKALLCFLQVVKLELCGVETMKGGLLMLPAE